MTAHPSWRPFCARTRSSDSASGGCADVLETLLKESDGSDSSSNGLPAHASTAPVGRCRASATRRSTPCNPLLCSTAILADAAMSLDQQCTLRDEQGGRGPMACGKVGQRGRWAWLRQAARIHWHVLQQTWACHAVLVAGPGRPVVFQLVLAWPAHEDHPARFFPVALHIVPMLSVLTHITTY